MSKLVSASMYFLSFMPLWLTVLFMEIKSLVDGGGDKWTEKISICIIVAGVLVALFILFTKFFKINDENYIFKIKEAKESKIITAEFLLSYILPLFAFEFTRWDEVVKFMIFFWVLGYLCIRHNCFSVNIILDILHYRIYECSLINRDGKELERMVISRSRLTMNKGETIEVKILNNDYCLDLYDGKKKLTKTDGNI